MPHVSHVTGMTSPHIVHLVLFRQEIRMFVEITEDFKRLNIINSPPLKECTRKFLRRQVANKKHRGVLVMHSALCLPVRVARAICLASTLLKRQFVSPPCESTGRDSIARQATKAHSTCKLHKKHGMLALLLTSVGESPYDDDSPAKGAPTCRARNHHCSRTKSGRTATWRSSPRCVLRPPGAATTVPVGNSSRSVRTRVARASRRSASDAWR